MHFLVAHRDGFETVWAAGWRLEEGEVVFHDGAGDVLRRLPLSDVRMVASIVAVSRHPSPRLN